MSVDSTNKWIQLAANIGLILGLVFVGLQMKQDRELKRAEFVVNAFETLLGRELVLMGDNPAAALTKAVYRPEELTPEDVLVVTALLDHLRFTYWRGTVLEELGIFTDRWRAQEDISDWIFETGVGKRWLETAKVEMLHPEIRKVLETERNRQETSPTANYREWLDYLRTGLESANQEVQ